MSLTQKQKIRLTSPLSAFWKLGCGIVLTMFLLPIDSRAQSPPNVGRPILFVHGFCDDARGWDGPDAYEDLAKKVVSASSAASSPFYPDTAIHKLYYDGQNVRQWPGGEDFLSTTGPTARFFALSFFDGNSTGGNEAFATIDPNRVASIPNLNKADELAHVIWAITTATHVKDVLVIAHSMGGLNSRAYLEGLASPFVGGETTPYAQNVAQLVTVDTPHSGAATADWPSLMLGPCFALESTNKYELTPGSDFLSVLNSPDNLNRAPNDVGIVAIQDFTVPGTLLGSKVSGDDGVVSKSEQSIQAVAPDAPGYSDVPNQIAIDPNQIAIDPLSSLLLPVPYGCVPLANWPLHLLTCLSLQPSLPNLIDQQIEPVLYGGQLTSVTVNATLDGRPWTGNLSFRMTGVPAIQPAVQLSAPAVPATFYDGDIWSDSVPPGVYTLSYVGSGPSSKYAISPSPTQFLGSVPNTGQNAWNLTFTIAFTSEIAVPTGSLSASPNPCTASAGSTCTSFITWSATNVTDAHVFVSVNGGAENLFADSTSCTGQNCPASFIAPGSTYKFTLYDYSTGSRGASLGSVVVAATMPSSGGSFQVGSRVMAWPGGYCNTATQLCVINVRNAQLAILFQQAGGVHGTVVDGPISGTADGFSGNWWKINWDAEPPNQNGQTGWSAESVLALAPRSGDISRPDLTSSYYTSSDIFWPTYAPPEVGASGNCTWYAFGRLLELGMSPSTLKVLHNNASDWATQAGGTFQVDSIPAVHSVGQLDSKAGFSLGHVAVVESLNPDGTITVTESSYDTSSSSVWNFLWRHRTVSPTWFDHFIHADIVAIVASIGLAGITPPSVVLAQGGTPQTVNITIARTNFAGTVTLSVGSLPAGVTAAITHPSLGNSGSIIFQASSSAAVVSGQLVTITASGTGIPSVTATVSITVTPGQSLPTLTSFSISPGTVASGGYAMLSFTLSGLAPSGGATINLSADNSGFPVPPTFTILAGQTSASFSTPSSASIAATMTTIVTATYNGSSRTASITVTVASLAPPVITVIQPSNISATSSRQLLTIVGTGFQAGLTATLTAPSASAQTFSGSQIQNFSPTTFQISVVLITAGTWTLSVRNSDGQSSVPASITVAPQANLSLNFTNWPPGFTVGDAPASIGLQITNSSAGFVSGTATATTSNGVPWLTVDGHASDTWTIAPSVGSSTSVTLTANPSGLAPGTYNGSVVVNAPNAANATITVAVTMTVLAKLQITTTSLPTATWGQSYSDQLQATGGNNLVWSLQSGSSLPPNLTLSTSGLISGTLVVANSASSWPFTVFVTDSINRTQYANLVIQIQPPIVVTSTAPSSFQFTVGQTYTTVVGSSVTFKATGGTSPYIWSGTNAPPGLHMDAPSGTLVGTPTQPGTFSTTVAATDSTGRFGTATFSLVVVMTPLVITSANLQPPPVLPSGTVGAAYTSYLDVTGGSNSGYQWTVTGFPPGITGQVNPASSCASCSYQISGTPLQAGSYTLSVKVIDSLNNSATANVTLLINSGTPPTITTSTLTLATVGQSYNVPFAATGGTPPYQWSFNGASPDPGLQLSSSGTLQGTSSVANDCYTGPAFWVGNQPPFGTFTPSYFQVKVTDSAGQSANKQFCLPAYYTTPQITSLSPPNVTADGQGHTVTVNGSNFRNNGQIYNTGNGFPTFISSTALSFTLTPATPACTNLNSSFVFGLSTGGCWAKGTYTLWIVQPYSQVSNQITFTIN